MLCDQVFLLLVFNCSSPVQKISSFTLFSSIRTVFITAAYFLFGEILNLSLPLPNAVNVILMLRANGRKIVGQLFPTLLDVASVCTPCYMLWRVNRSCCTKFETGQTLSYVQTEAATSSNVGSCWPTTLRPFAGGFNLANFGHFITSPLYGRCKEVRESVNM